jgi:Protein of unknown function (DUF2924)
MAKAGSKKVRPKPPRSVEIGKLTVKEAHVLWRELFGVSTKTRNLPYLRKRLALRMKELDQDTGSLLSKTDSAEAQADVAPPPRKGLRKVPAVKKRGRDPRLPGAGTTLVREYQGKRYKVAVCEQDFEYAGKRFGSLSTIAKEITGQVWNGFVFFRSALLEGGGETVEKGAA